MPNECGKQISTENGVLSCDQGKGHKGMHHAAHPGGRVPAIDGSKTKDGEPIFVERAPYDIKWPQEGDYSPVVVKQG